MEKEESKNGGKKPRINKLKISKLFFEMNPMYEPSARLKLAENFFSNKLLMNTLIKKKNKSLLSYTKRFPNRKINNLKYIYEYSKDTKLQESNNNINNSNDLINNKYTIDIKSPKNFLMTTLKLPKYSRLKNKMIINKQNLSMNNNKNKLTIDKGILNKTKYYVIKIDKDMEKKVKTKNKIEICNNSNVLKKSLSLNILEKSSENNVIFRNDLINKKILFYKISHRNKMVLPKISKQYISPSFGNHKKSK